MNDDSLIEDRLLYSPITELRRSDNYEDFLAKQHEWIECLRGDDPNSINNQVTNMIWDAGAYRMVNEARSHAERNEQGDLKQNGMVHCLLDKCFFESQMAAVRRQMDTYGLTGERGTYSLNDLLDDMIRNMSLLTRGNYFTAEKRKWDTKLVREMRERWRLERVGKGAVEVPEECDFVLDEERHQIMDMLCDVPPDQRSAEDTVREEVLQNLKSRLNKECDLIKKQVNQYLAHCATPESRRRPGQEEAKATIGHMWEAHKVICEVMNFVSIYLLTGNVAYQFLPISPFDPLKYFDEPLIPSVSMPEIREAWKNYRSEIESWEGYGPDELLREIGTQSDDIGLNSITANPSQIEEQS